MCEGRASLRQPRPRLRSTNESIFSSALAYTAEPHQAMSDNAGGMLRIEESFFFARTIGKKIYGMRQLSNYWRSDILEDKGRRRLSIRTGMLWKSTNPTHFTTSNRYWDCMFARLLRAWARLRLVRCCCKISI